MTKCPLCMTFHGSYIKAGVVAYWGECDSCEQYIREYYNKNRIINPKELEVDALESELKSASETSTHSPQEIQGGGCLPPDNNLNTLVTTGGLDPHPQPAPGEVNESDIAAAVLPSPGTPCLHQRPGCISLNLQPEGGFLCSDCGERVG